jgi:hypothetical protein
MKILSVREIHHDDCRSEKGCITSPWFRAMNHVHRFEGEWIIITFFHDLKVLALAIKGNWAIVCEIDTGRLNSPSDH